MSLLISGDLTLAKGQPVPNDPSFAFNSLLLHGNGANGSTTITDSSGSPKTVTANGNAQISTAQSKFGGASIAFDGTGDYLETPSNTSFDLGSSYTIEFWMRANSLASNAGLVHRGFYTTTNTSWDGFAFSIRLLPPNIRFYFFGTTGANEQFINVPVSGNVSTNTWHHVAMVRNGTNGAVYIDGVSKGTISSLNTPAASGRTLQVGIWTYNGPLEYFNGYIDDLRITKGVARYTANFTPPTAPFPDF